MEHNPNIALELKEISPTVAAIENNNPFSVPHGYFDAFPGKILEMIRKESVDFSLAVNETEALSPLLASLKQKTTFTVPENYFEQFNAKITENTPKQIKEQHAAPVRSISDSRKWVKYAAAAAIAGLVGLGSVLFLNNSGNVSGNDKIHQENALAANDQRNTTSADELSKVPDTILNEYLAVLPTEAETDNADSADAAFYNLALLNIDDKGLADILHEVSDDDLKNFAEENRNYLSL